MSSRRAFLASLAAVAVGGCAEFGGDAATPTTTATPAPVALTPTPPERVPADATVGLLPAAADALRSSAADAPTTAGDGHWWGPVAAFDCLTVDGTPYAVTDAVRGGGYENTYDVTPVTDAGNDTVVPVSALPAEDRAAVVRGIELGEYAFDSTEGGYRPNGTVLAYDGTEYAFEQTRHADFPTQRVRVLERVDGESDACPTVAGLELDGTHRDAVEAARHDDGDLTVPAATARALRDGGYGFVVVGTGCYAVPAVGE
ncbi:hypothetical protein [Haloarcula marina]|uniref:hypothetical protein n=1 Tax=Haloarcula marina TaxID=2961574 RepID=UPI0020B870D4|nr:hypothetical protein [Halomicroarcula marina]